MESKELSKKATFYIKVLSTKGNRHGKMGHKNFRAREALVQKIKGGNKYNAEESISMLIITPDIAR